MILSDVSIKRPVFATMLNVALVVFGLFSLPRLPVEEYPNVDFPVVSVYITYSGADPITVSDQVIEPMEKALNGIAGLDTMSSTAYAGAGLIILRFELERNSQAAAQDVRDRVFAAIGELPSDADTPIIQRYEFGAEPIIFASMSSASVPFAELSRLANDVVQPRLQRVKGVAKVDLRGDRAREILVFLDRNRMNAFGVTPSDVMKSIRSQNVEVPGGKIDNDQRYLPIRVVNKAKTPQDIGAFPILTAKGTAAHISDVARVVDGLKEEETAGFVNESRSILLGIAKESGGNTNAIADGIRSDISDLQKTLPKEVKLEIVSDASKYVKSSIDSVKLDLLVGAILAVLIVLIFLRDIRATLISSISLPTAVIGTFAFVNFMGFTLNMMTTLGLSLSIGILIDDAIVVIENIHRHLQMGKTPVQAAQEATSEIGLAVFATTLTICAVFVPVAYMQGIIGRFFYQFGLTVAFAVLISLFVAFTVTPMLSSRLLKREHDDTLSRGIKGEIEKVILKIEKAYHRLLALSLHYRKTTLSIGVFAFMLSIVLLRFVPVAFFPQADRGQFDVSFAMPENTSLAVTKQKSLEISSLIRKYPGVKNVVTSVASGNDNNPNAASLNVILVDKDERAYSDQDLMNRLRKQLAPMFPKPDYELNIGQGDGGNLQLVFLGDDRDVLDAFTKKVAKYIQDEVPGAVDISTSVAKPRRELSAFVNLGQAADLHIPVVDAGQYVQAMFDGANVGKFKTPKQQITIRVKLAPEDRREIVDVASLPIASASGLLPLNSVAAIKEDLAPATLQRYNSQAQITVKGNYIRQDLSDAIAKIKTYVDTYAPSGVRMDLAGEARIMQESIVAMLTALLFAVILIYMILCAQYERYMAPFVIMMALPLSFTGAFGALLLAQQAITVYTMIGLILLMGLVTKNGILLIDFTLQRMRHGLSTYDALMEAGPIRLRPILMTTFAAGFGMLPIALGHGEGGEAKSSMGIAVIGGLFMSTLLTLVVVPCLFLSMENLRNKLGLFLKQRFKREAH